MLLEMCLLTFSKSSIAVFIQRYLLSSGHTTFFENGPFIKSFSTSFFDWHEKMWAYAMINVTLAGCSGPDVIPCGWLGLKHQVTKKITALVYGMLKNYNLIIFLDTINVFCQHQSFADDDTQLLHSCPPDQIHAAVLTMQTCISDVKTWVTQNKLKLNDEKTEAVLIKSNRTTFPDAQTTSLHGGSADIPLN